MRINADDPTRWAADIAASVEMYNKWFRDFAPEAYRGARKDAATAVEVAMAATRDFAEIDAIVLALIPGILPVLRMATCPPLARDRLTGLSGSTGGIVSALDTGRTVNSERPVVMRHLEHIASVLKGLVDVDQFPWLPSNRPAARAERRRAAAVIADRLLAANAEPIIRNAQEARQLQLIEQLLLPLHYRRATFPADLPLQEMPAGTYAFRMTVMVGPGLRTKLPIDVVLQPVHPRTNRLPILIEAKSAGDFTNTNKRRKEEAQKHAQLIDRFGPEVVYVLFLCGYFGKGYLSYEADSGMDFIWEHRPEDLIRLGL